ncbi:hypothetical protein AB0N05_28375 [Nocardia sp. NPDC051030]|uniref:hypothetical protein n=1 Tax=Nocardia sp. NPDC051030 TaxID=3155162 RepID=UPI003420BEB9
MIRLGIWLMVLGFGSLLLEKANMHFVILSWADDMQPVFGIGLGLVGVVVTMVAVGLKAGEKSGA